MQWVKRWFCLPILYLRDYFKLLLDLSKRFFWTLWRLFMIYWCFDGLSPLFCSLSFLFCFISSRKVISFEIQSLYFCDLWNFWEFWIQPIHQNLESADWGGFVLRGDRIIWRRLSLSGGRILIIDNISLGWQDFHLFWWQ